MINNDPWYTRTEFWTMVASVIGGIFGVHVATNPIAQNVSVGLSTVAPLLYMYGRGNVKTAGMAAMAASQALVLEPPTK